MENTSSIFSTENIEKDGISCLESNGYQVKDKKDSFVSVDDMQQLKLFVKGYKDNNVYCFEMLLSDDELICNTDDKIRLDMKPYKEDVSEIKLFLEERRKKQLARTPKEVLEDLIENTNLKIEYNLEYEEDEIVKRKMIPTIIESINYCESYALLHNIDTFSEINNRDYYIK